MDWWPVEFLKKGFDVFLLSSFEDKSGLAAVFAVCQEVDWDRELQLSSFDRTKAQTRVSVASVVR